jgi:AraC-like DNA-binding protein
MAKTEYNATCFKLTHTIEEQPPHPTIPYDYYDDNYAITILIRGEGTCSVEGNVYEIKDGDLMVLSPDEIRSFKFGNHGYHERLSVYFTDSVLLPLFEYDLPVMNVFRNRSLGLGNMYSFDIYERERIIAITDQLKELAQKENDPINTARIHTLIFQLLFWLYTSRNLKQSQERAPELDSVIFDICCYIKNNLDKDLSYKKLKDRFLVSQYQLTEVFSRNMGMTLTKYIIRKRLNRVVSLVREGWGIEESAYKAGFHTYSHFYKEFSKYYKKSQRAFFAK